MIAGMKKIKTSWLILILALLAVGTAPVSGHEKPDGRDAHYAIGHIEGNVALIDLAEYSSPDTAPGIVGDIGHSFLENFEGQSRKSVDIDDLSDYLPEWVFGEVMLVGPKGRIVIQPTTGFVEMNICAEDLIIGFEIEVPDDWAVPVDELFEAEPDGSPSRREWAVLVEPAFEQDAGPGSSPANPTDDMTEIFQDRLDDYAGRFLDELPEDFDYAPDQPVVWWEIIPGQFEGCGEKGTGGGGGWAVFYCIRMWEYGAAVVEIVDGSGNVMVSVKPWGGGPDPDVYYQAEPLGVSDVDGDGWDELIVLKGYYEGHERAVWDPSPSGTIELAESFYRGC